MILKIKVSVFRELGDIGPEGLEFLLEVAGEDGKSAPGLGIDIFIIDMEAGGVAFAFPLISAPESEKAIDPMSQLFGSIVRKLDP